MKYIAYTYYRGKEWQSAEFDSREQAARQALACFPKLKSVATAVAVHDGIMWRTYGGDIRWLTRAECGR